MPGQASRPRAIPGLGFRAVLTLVVARLGRRRGAAALVALAVAAAIVVVGSLFGVGVVTADKATRGALADLKPRDRVVQVNRYADAAGNEDAASADVAAAMAPLAPFAEPVLSAVSLQPQIGFATYFALDGIDRWVSVTEGRLPKPCDGGPICEVIRVSDFGFKEGPGNLGSTDELGGIHVTVVGIGKVADNLPLDPLSANGLVYFVDGVQPLLHSSRVADLPRTRFWVAPLDPERTRSWLLEDLRAAVDGLKRAVAAADASYVVSSPELALDAVQGRIAIATGRLVFIGSLIVAVLLAFAVFAAAVERDDVGLEYRRLRVHGARGWQLLVFVIAEAAIPAIAGAVIGWLVAAGIVGAIGANQGAPPVGVLQVSLLAPGAVGLIAGVSLLALAAVTLGIHPGSGRLIQPRLIAVGVIPVVAVLAWDRLNQGASDPADLARTASGPGTVLLPGLLGLTVILGSLVVLPPLFRRLARLAQRAPLAIRLAFLAIAREPLRPAATTTLLAFSLGAGVFALGHSATLRQGAADEAAFVAGMDIRVRSLTPDEFFGAEVIRSMALRFNEPGVEVHPAFSQNAITVSGRPLTVLGIEPTAIPELRGWRPDFAPRTPAQIATAIAQPGDWQLPGVAIPPGARAISIDVQSSGDQVRLTAIVETHDDQVPAAVGYEFFRLGDLAGGRQTLSAPLFEMGSEGLPADYPKGWRIVALVASSGGPAASTGSSSGERQRATVVVRNLPGIVDPATPLHLDVSGSHAPQVIHGPAATDGLVVPGVVTPDLEDDLDADGVLTISMATGFDLRVRPVAIASHIPTLTDPTKGGVMVDEGPLLLGLNAAGPGAGVPNTALIRTPDDATTASVAKQLGETPFPPLRIDSRPALEAARANDPFAVGIVWALAVGALAGIALSLAGIVLAAAARLRDERGELGELEEQGLAPASLEGLTVLQTIVLAIAGGLIGAIVGLGLGWLAAASIAVTADGAPPIPPLVPVAPWLGIGGLVLAVVVVLAIAVGLLARRHFGSRLLREVPR